MRPLIQLFRSFSSELDPVRLQKKFLEALLEIQQVDRGSIWIREGDQYRCVEAAGDQSDQVKGIRIRPEQASVVGWVIENGRMTVADARTDPRHYRLLEANLDIKSSLIFCFPLLLKDGSVYGAVQLIDTSPDPAQEMAEDRHLAELQELVNIGADALNNALLYSKELREKVDLQNALNEIRREPVLVGQAPAFRKALELMGNYARTDYPVLITGESGTGKELFARQIHQLSTRSKLPFRVQNCSAIPETLLESELFGYRKGAFSGAVKNRVGLFESADGGTLFLDEIGDMPVSIQAKILRVLQGGEIKPLGSSRVKRVDVRIISATNREVRKMVDQKTFRQDLFFRLSVLPLHLPSLRDRREDIPLLLNHFIKREASRMGVTASGISAEAIQCLNRYPWSGNIRELENLVRYLLVVAEGRQIGVRDFPDHIPVRYADLRKASAAAKASDARKRRAEDAPEVRELAFADRTWEEMEREYALHLMEQHQWNTTKAAAAAGLNRSTFASRLRRLGIKKRR